MTRNEGVYWSMVALATATFAIGCAAALGAPHLRRFRAAHRKPTPGWERAAGFLTALIAVLGLTIVGLSAYLLVRLFRIYSCVYPPS